MTIAYAKSVTILRRGVSIDDLILITEKVVAVGAVIGQQTNITLQEDGELVLDNSKNYGTINMGSSGSIVCRNNSKNYGTIDGNSNCDTNPQIIVSPIDESLELFGPPGNLGYSINTFSISAVSDPADVGLELIYKWQYSEDYGQTWFDYTDGRTDYYWPPPWINPDALPPTDAANADYYRIVSGSQTDTLVVTESRANIAYRKHNARRVIISALGAETTQRTWKLFNGDIGSDIITPTPTYTIQLSPINLITRFAGSTKASDSILTFSTDAYLIDTNNTVISLVGLELIYKWQYSEDYGQTWFDYTDGRTDYYWPPAWELEPWTLPPSPASSADYYRIVSGSQTNTLVVRESWANIAYRAHNARRVIVLVAGAEPVQRTWKLFNGDIGSDIMTTHKNYL